MMYRYDYIERIGRFYHKARAGNSFGATLHQALHDFHVAGGAAVEDASVLTRRAMQSWRSAGFDDADEEEKYRLLACTLLQNYHRSDTARAGKTRVFIAEKTIRYDMGDFVLTGRIDRIDEHLDGGALEIVDYKSGRTEVTTADVESALAMCIYQLILKRIHPDRRVRATIHALRSGDSATVELTDRQLATWESDIREIGKRILNTDWESVRPVFMAEVCPDCDFYRLCERTFRRERELQTNVDY